MSDEPRNPLAEWTAEQGARLDVEERPPNLRAYKVWVQGLDGVGCCTVQATSPEQAALHMACALPFMPARAGAFSVREIGSKVETRCVVSAHVVTVPNTTTGVNLADPKGRPTVVHFASEPPEGLRKIVTVKVRKPPTTIPLIEGANGKPS